MIDTLVDAGPLVAVMNRRDDRHAECSALLRSLDCALCTTLPVLTEAMHLLGQTTPPCQDRLWAKVLCGDLVVEEIAMPDLRRMAELMRKHAGVPMDFADASPVAVAERMRLDRIFTVNRKHFTLYRLHGKKAFTVLGP